MIVADLCLYQPSHPVRVRGLKPVIPLSSDDPEYCRTPCGCVG